MSDEQKQRCSRIIPLPVGTGQCAEPAVYSFRCMAGKRVETVYLREKHVGQFAKGVAEQAREEQDGQA